MKNRRLVLQILMILCGAMLFFSGCGIKGPPLPPEIKGRKIAAPFDLQYTLEDSMAHLSWKHTVDDEKAVIEPEGFEVFMAERTFKACTGCPFEFRMIGFVSMPEMHFSVKVKKEYKYYFRIQATGDDNMKSQYSKTIQFANR